MAYRQLFLSLLLLGMAHPSNAAALAPPQELRLTVSQPMVDVGDSVTLSLVARSWPSAASAVVSFLSQHHGFTGRMSWDITCSCFRTSVGLARRIHPVELARAVANVHIDSEVVKVATTFLIRGLAPNGRTLANAGPPVLSAWVSDRKPLLSQYQHYCGWIRTLDSIGVPGVRIAFVVHYPGATHRWMSAPTGRTGVACVHKPVGSTLPGVSIAVDVRAENLTAHTTFTPQL